MRFTYQNGAQPLAGYTIQRGIHRGGFGEVYFAHSDGGKEVALKLLHRQDQDVEIRGVKQCLNLKHPNLVNLFDLKTDSQGDHWVIMEYVSGSSLEDVLESFPDGLPVSEVRDWLAGLVAGVAYLHDRGIVHRDLKPANVYRENGVVKVGDVGLSKRLDSDHRRQHTQSVGTVYYMAPEVARGQYGPEVDVYSLGVMLYELITGKLPFTGETTAEILMKHLTAQPDLTVIPNSLRPAIARSLEKDPRKRTPTVRDLERDFLRGMGASSVPQEIPETAFLPPVPPRINGQTRYGTSSSNSEPNGRPTGHRMPEQERLRESPSLPRTELESSNQSTIPKVLIVILGLALLFSRIKGESPWMLIVGGVACAVYYVSKKNSTGAQISRSRTNGQVRSESVPSFRAYAAAPTQPVRTFRTMAEPRPRPIARPWSERWPELAHSLGIASLIACVISLGIYTNPLSFPAPKSAVIPSSQHAMLFAATSIVGSWIFLIGNAITSGSRWTHRQRWLARLGAGILLGTFAYGIDEFLMVTTPPGSYTARGAISKLGDYSLTGLGSDPSWLGYACFFASWTGIRRWNREMDHRKTLRIGSVFTAVMVAFVVCMIFRFPQWYALLWAGTISTTVQLASSWSRTVSSDLPSVGREIPGSAQTTDGRSPFHPVYERR